MFSDAMCIYNYVHAFHCVKVSATLSVLSVRTQSVKGGVVHSIFKNDKDLTRV